MRAIICPWPEDAWRRAAGHRLLTSPHTPKLTNLHPGFMGRVGVAGYPKGSTRVPRRHAWGPRRASMAPAIQVASPRGVPNASFPAGDRFQRLRHSIRTGSRWTVGKRPHVRFTQGRSRDCGASTGGTTRRLRRRGAPRQTHRVPQTGQGQEARRGRKEFLHQGLRRSSLNRRCLDTPGRSGLCCRREAPDGKRRINPVSLPPATIITIRITAAIRITARLSHGR